jgi:hypothetical protein
MRWNLSYEDFEAVEMAYKAAWLREAATSPTVVGIFGDIRRNGWWTVLSLSQDQTSARLVVGTLVGMTPTHETLSFSSCDDMLARVSALAAHAEIDAPKISAPGKTSVEERPPEYTIVTQHGRPLMSRRDRALANYAQAVLRAADTCLAAERRTP